MFAEGDQVMLSTANINLAGYGTEKLKPRWIGPFTILEKRSDVVYKLSLPSSMAIHPVFHISRLKPYK